MYVHTYNMCVYMYTYVCMYEPQAQAGMFARCLARSIQNCILACAHVCMTGLGGAGHHFRHRRSI